MISLKDLRLSDICQVVQNTEAEVFFMNYVYSSVLAIKLYKEQKFGSIEQSWWYLLSPLELYFVSV